MAEKAILEYLQTNEEISNTGDFAASTGIDHEEVKNITRSLHGFQLVDAQEIKKEIWELTDEAKIYAETGSPEFRLYSAVPPEGSISQKELQQILGTEVYRIGCQAALQKKWLEMRNQQLSRKPQAENRAVKDFVKDWLLQIKDGYVSEDTSSIDIKYLKKRKLIDPKL